MTEILNYITAGVFGIWAILVMLKITELIFLDIGVKKAAKKEIVRRAEELETRIAEATKARDEYIKLVREEKTGGTLH